MVLNPKAAEYFPSQKPQQLEQELQPLPSIYFPPLTASIFDHHSQFFVFSSLPCRQTNPLFYSTTFPLLPPSIPFLTKQADIKTDVEAHADAVHQNKDEPKTGDSKGFLENPLHDCWRPKTYPPRRKLEVNGQRENVDSLGNRKDFRHSHEQRFRGIPKRNRFNPSGSPSLPVRKDGYETTVMIRNIPSKYTRGMLVDFLEDHCLKVNRRDQEACKDKGEEGCGIAFDFVYIPIDFKTKMNKGYAFVNFTNPQAAWKFCLTASNMKWDKFESHKIREVATARLQGKERLKKHFETMNFPCDSEDFLPVSFSPPCDGVVKGTQRTMGKLMK